MKIKLMVIVAFAMLAGACLPFMPQQKHWAATGGSRSDAVVRMSYEFASYEIPEVNPQEAVELASQRCKSWGYSEAEAFGGETRACNQYSGSGCASWLVTKEFQCIGRGDARVRK
ncbi:MAG: YecR-like lipofamily protein [Desulfovibrio sp.]|jgi:hypothetical protein|nr:YecR-like lipofamily protein [Desulfovibrio sp.]